MANCKIIYDRHTCIGALQCISQDEPHFDYADDGKVTLSGGEETARDRWELEIGEDQREIAVKAAQACPVRAIEIVDADTGDVIAP